MRKNLQELLDDVHATYLVDKDLKKRRYHLVLMFFVFFLVLVVNVSYLVLVLLFCPIPDPRYWQVSGVVISLGNGFSIWWLMNGGRWSNK